MSKKKRGLPNLVPSKELNDRMRDLTRDSMREYFDVFDARLRDYLNLMRDYQDEIWEDDDDKKKSKKSTKKDEE